MANKEIKKDEVVVVISGRWKPYHDDEQGLVTRSGKILSVDRKRDLVTVEGINVRKKATRRSQENPEGGFTDKEMSIHISNVMLESEFNKRRGIG
jgi:large subunit ribosomal protein L24